MKTYEELKNYDEKGNFCGDDEFLKDACAFIYAEENPIEQKAAVVRMYDRVMGEKTPVGTDQWVVDGFLSDMNEGFEIVDQE